jgi:hypothetical protein
MSRDSSIRAGRPSIWGLIAGRGKVFLFSTAAKPALGPTQPPIQRLPGVKRSERTTHLHLVPNVTMLGFFKLII